MVTAVPPFFERETHSEALGRLDCCIAVFMIML